MPREQIDVSVTVEILGVKWTLVGFKAVAELAAFLEEHASLRESQTRRLFDEERDREAERAREAAARLTSYVEPSALRDAPPHPDRESSMLRGDGGAA
jgi:hypothetical protein